MIEKESIISTEHIALASISILSVIASENISRCVPLYYMQKTIAVLLSGSGKGLRVAIGSRVLKLAVLLTALFVSTGCATTSTLNQPVHERNPLVMSGTRLDLASLRNEPAVKDKFGVSAPRYPLLDLPFSVFLDFIVLGYTVPVALFY